MTKEELMETAYEMGYLLVPRYKKKEHLIKCPKCNRYPTVFINQNRAIIRCPICDRTVDVNRRSPDDPIILLYGKRESENIARRKWNEEVSNDNN